MRTIPITAELIEEAEGGYTVYCPELDIYTQGDNEVEAIENLQEAAELHIEEIGIENLELRKVQIKKMGITVNV
ncbi:MAG: type II toxin-antitoxin system HicB family antitoxin [Candidatus Poribacteria bacterium]